MTKPVTFTLFQDLPVELRLRIWEFAVEVLRAHGIMLHPGEDSVDLNTRATPALLHVCRESRECVLLRTQDIDLSTSTRAVKMRGVKLDIDIFYLQKSPYNGVDIEITNPSIKKLSSCQVIAVVEPIWKFWSRNLEGKDFLSHFPKLLQVIIVVFEEALLGQNRGYLSFVEPPKLHYGGIEELRREGYEEYPFIVSESMAVWKMRNEDCVPKM